VLLFITILLFSGGKNIESNITLQPNIIEKLPIKSTFNIKNSSRRVETISMRSRKTKRYMSRFKGISKANFWVCLKEYEGRLNTPDPKRQLLNLKRWVTKHTG